MQRSKSVRWSYHFDADQGGPNRSLVHVISGHSCDYCVFVLQNHMDLLKGELGSCNKTSKLDGNTGASIECEMVSHVTEEEATTIPSIKMEPSESCVPVVSVTQITYRIYPELPAPISLCHCERKF